MKLQFRHQPFQTDAANAVCDVFSDSGFSRHLTAQQGKGYYVPTLKNIRQCYQVYSPSIQQALLAELDQKSSTIKSYSLISLFGPAQKGQTLSALFSQPWTHYQVLMRVENATARRLYGIETPRQQRSVM